MEYTLITTNCDNLEWLQLLPVSHPLSAGWDTVDEEGYHSTGVVAAQGSPDVLAPVVKGLVEGPGWHVHLVNGIRHTSSGQPCPLCPVACLPVG